MTRFIYLTVQRWAGIQESNNEEAEEAEAIVDVSGFKPSCHHFMTLGKLLCFRFFEDSLLCLPDFLSLSVCLSKIPAMHWSGFSIGMAVLHGLVPITDWTNGR